MDTVPFEFIGELIEVIFDRPPLLEKKPDCPSAFIWRGEHFRIERLLEEWFDTERRGRMANNMRPEHAARASRTGSWGVGRFHFQVMVQGGRIFDIYFDRSPKNVFHRKGDWYLMGERKPGA